MMVDHFSTAAEVRAHVRDRLKEVMPALTTKTLPAETARAVRRFALIAVVGEFAAQRGLIPATASDVRQCVKHAVGNWLNASAETDDSRIISNVRGFILRHAARFQPVRTDEHDAGHGGWSQTPREKDPVRDRVGWVNHADGLWMFTDAGLIEAAPGNDKTTVACALRQAGFLFTNEAGKLKARVTTGEEAARPWLYAVKSTILSSTGGGSCPACPGRHRDTGTAARPATTRGRPACPACPARNDRQPEYSRHAERGRG
jgi:hypothetical protein